MPPSAIAAAGRNALHSIVEVPLLARLLALPRGGEILELGCGPGVASRALTKHLAPASLTGVDLNRAHIGRTRGRGTAVVQGDVTALPFSADRFDLVIDFGTCHHLDDPARALLEIARVLKPGGLYVHETSVAQAVAHPWHFHRRPLPWTAVPMLTAQKSVGLWAARRCSPELGS